MKRRRPRHVRPGNAGSWAALGMTMIVFIIMIIVVCDAVLRAPLP